MARDCCPIRETRKHQPGVIVIGAELPPIQARVGVEYAQAAHQQYGHADEVRPMPEARGQAVPLDQWAGVLCRSEEHTSELQSLMRISYAVFCLKKKSRTTSKTQPSSQHIIHIPTKARYNYII